MHRKDFENSAHIINPGNGTVRRLTALFECLFHKGWIHLSPVPSDSHPFTTPAVDGLSHLSSLLFPMLPKYPFPARKPLERYRTHNKPLETRCDTPSARVFLSIARGILLDNAPGPANLTSRRPAYCSTFFSSLGRKV